MDITTDTFRYGQGIRIQGSRVNKQGQPIMDSYVVDQIFPYEGLRLRQNGLGDGPFWRQVSGQFLAEGVANGTVEIRDDGWTDTHFAPPGECGYCDSQREAEATFFPSHQAMSHCRSGGRNHCTCDSCF